jgi:hypothetical protein
MWIKKLEKVNRATLQHTGQSFGVTQAACTCDPGTEACEFSLA